MEKCFTLWGSAPYSVRENWRKDDRPISFVGFCLGPKLITANGNAAVSWTASWDKSGEIKFPQSNREKFSQRHFTVQVTPSGHVTFGEGALVKVYNSDQRNWLTLKGHSGSVTSVSCSVGGSVVSCDDKKSVRT